MYKALLIDGLALVKVWAIGFFGFHISGIIHILPAIAILVFLVSFLSGKIFLRRSILLSSKPIIVKYPGNEERKK
jgi:hypothetical protein